MTLSALTSGDVRQYARVDDAEEDALLDGILAAARSFCLSYTGLTADEADRCPDMALAALIVSADLYDTRSYAVDRANVNPAAASILGMYARGLV